MDQQELHRWEERCIQEEPPACRAGCPLGVDGRAFALAMAAQDLRGARAILEKSMPLAGIVGRLCEAPCEDFCLRRDFGGAIALGQLERHCLAAGGTRGKVLRLPERGRRVAVLGGGPSSLVVAWELAKKGYQVDIHHQGRQAGGWLHHVPEDKLPAPALLEELATRARLGVNFFAATNLVLDLEAFGADALFCGRDDEGIPLLLDGFARPDPITMALTRPGFFAGGITKQGHRHRFILSVSQGREAAVSIDRFLQGASLTASRVPLRHGQTNLHTDTTTVNTSPRIVATAPDGYSHEEATAEAQRCLNCQCLECVKHCVYLAEYGSYPKVYARRIYNNSAIVKGVHQANRMINGCSLCDQCRTLCPRDFSMAELCLEARRQMVREKRMPTSAHEFALLEMRAASAETHILRHAPGKNVSRYLFFPGCQLAGIRPDQTLALYRRLLAIDGETGIWLDCCGAPAHWAGREEESSGNFDRLIGLWQSMGSPPLLVACSSCRKLFTEHLPQLPTVSVWSILADQPLPDSPPTSSPLALSDPCSARHDQTTREAVRGLAAALGQPLAPLPMSGELTECCGYGGLMANADPGLADKVVRARAEQSAVPLLTYCAMCRDRLATTGKEVVHLLDLLFPEHAHPAEEPPASLSARRKGRAGLKAAIEKLHGETWPKPALPGDDLTLAIPQAVAAQLEERRILEEDLRQVLAAAPGQGTFLVKGGSNLRLASARRGEVTFWVSYRLVEGVHHIEGGYSHRMRIGKEQP